MRRLDQPDVGPIEVAHQTLWLDGERCESVGPASGLGEHGRAVLEEAGLIAEAIDALYASSAVLTKTTSNS